MKASRTKKLALEQLAQEKPLEMPPMVFDGYLYRVFFDNHPPETPTLYVLAKGMKEALFKLESKYPDLTVTTLHVVDNLSSRAKTFPDRILL